MYFVMQAQEQISSLVVNDWIALHSNTANEGGEVISILEKASKGLCE
jgi:hypothetical protein